MLCSPRTALRASRHHGRSREPPLPPCKHGSGRNARHSRRRALRSLINISTAITSPYAQATQRLSEACEHVFDFFLYAATAVAVAALSVSSHRSGPRLLDSDVRANPEQPAASRDLIGSRCHSPRDSRRSESGTPSCHCPFAHPAGPRDHPGGTPIRKQHRASVGHLCASARRSSQFVAGYGPGGRALPREEVALSGRQSAGDARGVLP
jgi:hypothetical protein